MGTLRIKLTAIAMLALGAFGTASAIPIVDTGASTYVGPNDPGVSVSRNQFVAGRFTTTEDFAITGISAFVRNLACCGTPQLTLGIASGPDMLSDSALTNLIALTTRVQLHDGQSGWASVAVDNFTLHAGTWWLVAFVQPSSYYSLVMPGGVANPMDAYGVGHADGVWNPSMDYFSGTNIPGTYGFRLDGERVPPSVPEPGTLALFGIGLLAAGVARRRSQRA